MGRPQPVPSTLTGVERLSEFSRLLRRWNNAIRLVGDVGDEALARHVDDAMAVLPYLPAESRVLDVGSGNGFPAVPIALARPDLDVTLVEPIAKKVAFLRECRRRLRLDNIKVVRARDDELVARESFRPTDVAISQATFAPVEWLRRAAALVRPGGLIIAMLGEDRRGLDELRGNLGPGEIEVHEIETRDRRPRAIAVRRNPADDR